MERARRDFLFADVPKWLDPDDEDDRAELIRREHEGDETPRLHVTMHEIVANQIAADEPQEVWTTAQRLLARGLDRHEVLHQIMGALAPIAFRAVQAHAPIEDDEYERALAALPMPSAAEVEVAVVGLVREHQPVDADELDRLVRARFDRAEDDEVFEELLDRVDDDLTDPDWGPLALVAGDRVVEVASLAAGAVLTHRLTDAERELGVIPVLPDLALFTGFDTITLAGATVEAISGGPTQVAWPLPESWLAPHAPGTLLAARLDGDGCVHVDVLTGDREITDALVDAVRAAYDAEHESAGLPVWARELVLMMLASDRDVFAEARPPLVELCAAAGLECRYDGIAHSSEVWRRARMFHRTARVIDRLGDVDDRNRATALLDAWERDSTDRAELRAWLAELRDPFMLEALVDVIFLDDSDDALHDADELLARLVTAANRPAEHVVVHYLHALAQERHGRVLDAEANLQLAARADPDWEPALDRLAWYASDRGDAKTAARLWARVRSARAAQDLATVERFAQPAATSLRRNDPCWCGSGRKFKQCHLGVSETVPLPERVGWLCRKAAAYLERRGGDAADDVIGLAHQRAADPDDPDSVAQAFADPLVIDVALHEGGWFEHFLDQRGPLLPDDELILMRAWTFVERTVYEVVDTDPGKGMIVRDLRTGDRIDVRERAFSRDARPGRLVCGRAVPDGASHQFVGGLFRVVPGTETDILALVETGDPVELLHYVRDAERPPELRNREGEELVYGRAVVRVSDRAATRRLLDLRYEADDEEVDTWLDLAGLNEDENVLRARLALVDSEIHVSANSHERLDRVLDVLEAEAPGARVIDDTRRPLDPSPGATTGPRDVTPPADDATRALLTEYIERYEQRWCDEHIPALGGLTPREAAADPTRREELVRLIASFPEPPPGEAGMNPRRLRELLEL